MFFDDSGHYSFRTHLIFASTSVVSRWFLVLHSSSKFQDWTKRCVQCWCNSFFGRDGISSARPRSAVIDIDYFGHVESRVWSPKRKIVTIFILSKWGQPRGCYLANVSQKNYHLNKTWPVNYADNTVSRWEDLILSSPEMLLFRVFLARDIFVERWLNTNPEIYFI
jgi:hypothetical protein